MHITSIAICEPVSLPVKKSELKPSVMKILSTSTSPSEIYGQINLPVEITTPSNLGPSTIHMLHTLYTCYTHVTHNSMLTSVHWEAVCLSLLPQAPPPLVYRYTRYTHVTHMLHTLPTIQCLPQYIGRQFAFLSCPKLFFLWYIKRNTNGVILK